jgi:hypothetical protein
MTSPLDGRIRKLAREEAVAVAVGVAPAAAVDDDGRVDALEKEVAGLRQQFAAACERNQQNLTAVDALAARVQALEDAATPTVKTSTRRSRGSVE